MEKKYKEVLEKQGIQSEEIESMIDDAKEKSSSAMIKMFPKTEANGIKIGIRKPKKYDMKKYMAEIERESEKEVLHQSIEMDQTYSMPDESEAELGDSISIDVSVDTVKETD